MFLLRAAIYTVGVFYFVDIISLVSSLLFFSRTVCHFRKRDLPGMRHYKIVALFAVIFIGSPLNTSTAQQTRLLRMPAISESHVAFVYANDIWLANRDGSNVHRLTTFEGAETQPHFSPDGKWVAFFRAI